MPFDPFFSSAVKVRNDRSRGTPRCVMAMSEPERLEAVQWVSSMADWCVAADCTFGTGDWPGKRWGRRKDKRDGLLVVRKLRRGFDPDDALDLYRKFMRRQLPSVTWFAAVEPNPDHGAINPGFHIHSMWAGCDDVHRNTAARKWVEENGVCRIGLIRSRADAEDYCTKHLVRRGSIFGYRIASSELWHALKA